MSDSPSSTPPHSFDRNKRAPVGRFGSQNVVNGLGTRPPGGGVFKSNGATNGIRKSSGFGGPGYGNPDDDRATKITLNGSPNIHGEFGLKNSSGGALGEERKRAGSEERKHAGACFVGQKIGGGSDQRNAFGDDYGQSNARAGFASFIGHKEPSLAISGGFETPFRGFGMLPSSKSGGGGFGVGVFGNQSKMNNCDHPNNSIAGKIQSPGGYFNGAKPYGLHGEFPDRTRLDDVNGGGGCLYNQLKSDDRGHPSNSIAGKIQSPGGYFNGANSYGVYGGFSDRTRLDDVNGGVSELSSCYYSTDISHYSRQCPEPRILSGACYASQKPRNRSQESPLAQENSGSGFGYQGGGGGFGSGHAFEVHGGEESGYSRCYHDGGVNGIPPQDSFNCRRASHFFIESTEPSIRCFNCHGQGHRASACPLPPKEQDRKKCLASTFIPQQDTLDALYKIKVDPGVMFYKLFNAEVVVTPPVVYKPVRSFDDANLPRQVLQNVIHAGYTRTTPVQEHVMPLIALQNDLIACAQTGSGKTAAFLVAIMSDLIRRNDLNSPVEGGCYPRCFVLTPTRELADQIFNEGRRYARNTALSIKPAYGGTQVENSKHSLYQGATVIVATVGRLLHFISDNIVQVDKIRYIVIDEADCMIDGIGQIIMSSSTFSCALQKTAKEFLNTNFTLIAIDKIGAANKCVRQDFICCTRGEKKEELLQLLGVDLHNYTASRECDVYKKKTIVFVNQKKLVDTLGGILSQCEIPSVTIHSDRFQEQRADAMLQFRSGAKPVLIATAVAERGLDIKGVDHVINYDLPLSVDDYVHRIGRTGRVGNAGRSTSFVTDEDRPILPALRQLLLDAEQTVPHFMRDIRDDYVNMRKTKKGW
ncbi:unnamed protein product [Caenorhabditis auriculariae]|uniref:RNA helicase n=1 Tax=Caenorhabditis auriculariae TaxID=2777116 RepID=A0A8S1HNS0_9PELO|nr:unnamed protein product [Caenorhabditis auriculariae]